MFDMFRRAADCDLFIGFSMNTVPFCGGDIKKAGFTVNGGGIGICAGFLMMVGPVTIDPPCTFSALPPTIYVLWTLWM